MQQAAGVQVAIKSIPFVGEKRQKEKNSESSIDKNRNSSE
jgi:hypothetical protein